MKVESYDSSNTTADEINEWSSTMADVKPFDEQEAGAEQIRDPRVESLAIPLARDYAEKNYAKREDGTFEPAWRGINGEKVYKNKSPEDLMSEGSPL